jgi:GAF domain-containing protein
VAVDKPLVITDSIKDIRVQGNDEFTLQAVRAYIGVPIHSVEGQTIGSLCVFDSRPRKWTKRDTTTVSTYASLIRL